MTSLARIVLCLLLLVGRYSIAETVFPGAAVVSAHPLATNAGLAILAQGGNAFDAAVATAAVLGVVAPYHTGLGGGGFWLLHLADKQQNIFLDAREKAPLAATQNMFLDANGNVIEGLSLNGAMAAAIPGQPAALAYLAKRYGRLPLSITLEPAIRIAEKGFPIDNRFYNLLAIPESVKQLQRFPASAAIFLHNGKPFLPGELLVQKDLAKTLRLLAAHGHAGFYEGETAQRLVAANRAANGIWSQDDLKHYRIIIRKPLEGTYHGIHIVTAPPPSAGGVILLSALAILSDYSLPQLSKVQQIHYTVEAMRLAFWHANQFIADPAFVAIDLQKLLAPETIAQLKSHILVDKATPSASLMGEPIKEKQHNTTHLAVLDNEGNYVSATMTVNYLFGSKLVAAGTGVLLNDEMDDFSAKPGEKNVFGIVGSRINTIAPGKRPMSNMAPTFLETPTRLAIFGTPGGSRIPSMMLLSTLAFEQGAGAIGMVSTMRYHHQYLPDWLQFEPDTFTNAIQKQLKAMAYPLMALKQYYGDMQVISWDKSLQLITAVSDPRGIGLGVVITNGSKAGYGFSK